MMVYTVSSHRTERKGIVDDFSGELTPTVSNDGGGHHDELEPLVELIEKLLEIEEE